MSKTAMQQLIDWVDSISEPEKRILEHKLLHDPNDVKEARIVLDIYKKIIKNATNLRDTVEREQIRKDYLNGVYDCSDNNIDSENYYTQTYNQKEDNNE